MEYLMTYGWAILVIVIVLAALLYLGVFNLSNKVPDVCTFQVGLQCSAWRVSYNAGANVATFSAINGYQKEMMIEGAECSMQTADPTTGLPTGGALDVDKTHFLVGGVAAPAIPVAVEAQQTLTACPIICYDATGTQTKFSAGSSYSGKLYIKYYFTDEGNTAHRIAVADMKATLTP